MSEAKQPQIKLLKSFPIASSYELVQCGVDGTTVFEYFGDLFNDVLVCYSPNLPYKNLTFILFLQNP